MVKNVSCQRSNSLFPCFFNEKTETFSIIIMLYSFGYILIVVLYLKCKWSKDQRHLPQHQRESLKEEKRWPHTMSSRALAAHSMLHGYRPWWAPRPSLHIMCSTNMWYCGKHSAGVGTCKLNILFGFNWTPKLEFVGWGSRWDKSSR